MSQNVVTPTKIFEASGALAIHLRVKDNGSSLLALAGTGEEALGTLTQAALAANDKVAVLLASAQGTRKVVAAGAISAGAKLYPAASGQVNDVPLGKQIGIALEAATAASDVIEMLDLVAQQGDTKVVEAHTADDTLTIAESGSVHTTAGAAATVTFSMPAATLGLEFFFQVGAAQELRIDPNGTETCALPSSGVQGAAGKYLTANADGETVHLICTTAGAWSVFGYTGTWTAEG